MHEHTEKERVPADILRAFQQQRDTRTSGQISVRELRWLLSSWGDRLNKKEGQSRRGGGGARLE